MGVTSFGTHKQVATKIGPPTEQNVVQGFSQKSSRLGYNPKG